MLFSCKGSGLSRLPSIKIATLCCMLSACDSQDSSAVDAGFDPVPGRAESELPLDGHCLAGAAPGNTVVIERLLSDYRFAVPTDAATIPGASEPSIFVIEKRGRALFSPLRLEVAPSEIKTVLELPVTTEGDGGLLGIALHPDYANNHRVYVTYTTQDDKENKTLFLSEFTTSEDHLEWSNEKIILAHPRESELHYGGSLRFAPDGTLFMGFGDDSSNVLDDPRRQEAQNPRSMVGTIIRIDVDNPQAGLNYSIPTDNPAIYGLGITETYAFGLRNPWRMSFDSEWPHQLYVGDVGGHKFEEINAIDPGENYGWPECEGLCESSKTGFNDPLHEYERTNDGRAVIGGIVYRGKNMPSFRGKYIYGDLITKALYALNIETPSSNGSFPVETIANTELAMTGFFTDQEQEMYVFGAITHGLYRLVENSDIKQSQPPELLSNTGCFESIVDGNPVPNQWIKNYDINQQFWSDNAKKERLISLPRGSVVDTSDPYNWELPIGGVVIKHFRMQDTIFETRFLVRHENGEYAGYTYYWNDELDEAHLVNNEGTSRQLGEQTWQYPSRAQCVQCHTNQAGGTLALESSQLNVELTPQHAVDDAHTIADDESETINQIDHLIAEGYLSSDTESRLPAYPTVDELGDSSLPIDERVLSYLHVNCSSCHRGERSVGRANWDARYITAHNDKNLCNVPPLVGVHSVVEELVWPGNHQLSALFHRATTRGSDFDMPPIGSALVDPIARTLLAEWTDGLDDSCLTVD